MCRWVCASVGGDNTHTLSPPSDLALTLKYQLCRRIGWLVSALSFGFGHVSGCGGRGNSCMWPTRIGFSISSTVCWCHRQKSGGISPAWPLLFIFLGLLTHSTWSIGWQRRGQRTTLCHILQFMLLCTHPEIYLYLLAQHLSFCLCSVISINNFYFCKQIRAASQPESNKNCLQTLFAYILDPEAPSMSATFHHLSRFLSLIFKHTQ